MMRRMKEEWWRRHANPWSVFTRFLAIPAFILAVWSRLWIGWWALGLVAIVVAWLWLNPFVFPPVEAASSWAAKGIHGEQLWLEHRERVPAEVRRLLALLIGVGLVGFACIAWGLVTLHACPTLLGTVLLVMAQLWRIDRMGVLFDQLTSERWRASMHGESHPPRTEARRDAV